MVAKKQHISYGLSWSTHVHINAIIQLHKICSREGLAKDMQHVTRNLNQQPSEILRDLSV